MTLPTKDVIQDLEELIKEVTGFKEDEENFVTCEQYCLSHFVHHTYPSINKRDVKDKIDSYASRFYTQGYFKVADAFTSQISSFLSNQEDFRKNPEYNIEWILLSLLCELSANLTSVSKVPELLPLDEEEEPESIVDWGELLRLDGRNGHTEARYDPNSDSFFSDESENEEAKRTHKAKEKEVENETKPKVIIYEEKKKSIDFSSRLKIIEEIIDSRQEENRIKVDKRKWGNFTEIYDGFLTSEGIHRESQLISEQSVIEKITYEFQTGQDIFLRRGIKNPALCSITQETLQDYLVQFKPYFKILKLIRDFSEDVSHFRFRDSSSELKKTVPNVVKAYSEVLCKALEPFEEVITDIDLNRSNYTLLKVRKIIRSYYFDLGFLYRTHYQAVGNWLEEPNWICAVRIISTLYNATMETTTSRMSRLYLNMFLHCFQVYLDIIETWISCDNLIDPHQEFIVTRMRMDQSLENGCCDYKVLPYKEVLIRLGIDKMEIFDVIADKMIHVGQSLDVLRKLDRFVEINQIDWNYSDLKSPNMHQSLLNRIQSEIKNLTCEAVPYKQSTKKSIFTIENSNDLPETSDGGEGEEKKVETKKENLDDDNNSGLTSRNRFFQAAFENIFDSDKKFQKKLEEKQESVRFYCECCRKEDVQYFLPLHKIIKQYFKPMLNDRVSTACILVKNIVVRECNLEKHLALLRSVLLFNDAYLIQPFTFVFFNQPETWDNSYSLSLHLRECVEAAYKNLASELSIIVAEDLDSPVDNILEAIDLIYVKYEVQWPLNLIINSDVMNKYNEIFRLILKLKWIHSMLCNLRFRKNDESTPSILKSTRHRLQLLRNWCLTELGTINNYFMTQVAIPLSGKLNDCKNLKDIINIHESFIRKIHKRCLLAEDGIKGRQLIFDSILPLCKEIGDCWLRGHVVANAKLSLMENIYYDCHGQLSSLMTSLEKE